MNNNSVIIIVLVSILALMLLAWWASYGWCDHSFRIGNVSGCVSEDSIKIR